ncbi:flavin-containing monooxygenase [Pseudodonghicola flavimaris]|uniref:NAD(P)/FAD-dependent oxidoreductase n=1 Tax=Pseudodonghicola flavimaris TaxID=3050036 RepID=A0ABT7F2E3_9RHOB|nr:NAD(P)/FAD-dependent oxidoreductase [Pseudodonghicola flavimaris]MDK3018775.1 NAD(P)/FAD-dependent oxidoreductase [Pseudodonghicola flavimaris]
MSLTDLERRLAEDLDYLDLPAASWVPPRRAGDEPVTDVLIVGAGMCGLAALAELRMLGIDKAFAVDAAPEGFEGPWETFARMRTLRSPKTLTGPALDLPALTFRAWFTAQWGAGAWDRLGKIPKDQWMDYLRWYRRVLALPVRNDTRLTDLRAEGPYLRVTLQGPDGESRLLARRVVLATGRSGLGGGAAPACLETLDPRFWAHSADDIDFEALRGRDVVVVGAGASAMDNAATALEAGAARVDLLIRRDTLPAVNKLTGIGSPGTVHGLAHLPDDWKLKIHSYAMAEQVPPPSHSVRRVSEHANAQFHFGCALTGAEVEGKRLRVDTSRGSFATDFLIAATGFRNDFADRAELSAIAPHVLSWADRPDFPDSLPAQGPLGQSPYLAADFTFLEKIPGSCPALARIHCFNDAAMLSHGKVSGDIPAVSTGAKRLGRAIAAAFFCEDRAAQFDRLRAFDTAELAGDEWTPAPRLPG